MWQRTRLILYAQQFLKVRSTKVHATVYIWLSVLTERSLIDVHSPTGEHSMAPVRTDEIREGDPWTSSEAGGSTN